MIPAERRLAPAAFPGLLAAALVIPAKGTRQ